MLQTKTDKFNLLPNSYFVERTNVSPDKPKTAFIVIRFFQNFVSYLISRQIP